MVNSLKVISTKLKPDQRNFPVKNSTPLPRRAFRHFPIGKSVVKRFMFPTETHLAGRSLINFIRHEKRGLRRHACVLMFPGVVLQSKC